MRNVLVEINFSNFQVINYDTLRGGISVDTRKGDVTTSHLLIQNADETNTGKYSCSPSNAIVANIRVHVLNGELCFAFAPSKNFHDSRFRRTSGGNAQQLLVLVEPDFNSPPPHRFVHSIDCKELKLHFTHQRSANTIRNELQRHFGKSFSVNSRKACK